MNAITKKFQKSELLRVIKPRDIVVVRHGDGLGYDEFELIQRFFPRGLSSYAVIWL